MRNRIVIAILLIVSLIPLVSAAGFVWTPTTATDYHAYQGDRIEGWLDNTLGEQASVIKYTWYDGSDYQYLLYARGIEVGGVREQGAALYPSLPADGLWHKTNSPSGDGFWGTSSATDAYAGTMYAGRDEAFYAGIPNTDNDFKANILTIEIYDRSTYPVKIQTISKTYYIVRLYPYVTTTDLSPNPHAEGSDIASQTLSISTSVSPYTMHTIDHYYITELGTPIMGSRYIRKWDSSTNQWLDTYWRQTLDNGVWSEWQGDYTWDEVLIGSFSVGSEGDYTLRSTFYDYKGRSHYGIVKDRTIEVISTTLYYTINFVEYPSGNPVTNNVYITIRALDDSLIFEGYMQGTEHGMSFIPPTTVKISATADGYSPRTPTVEKTFTLSDTTLTYEFTPIQYIDKVTNYHSGDLRFIVTEAGTYNPIPNAKVTIDKVSYFTDALGMVTITLPATEGEQKVNPFTFGDTGAGVYRLFGDFNGDGIDTACTYKNGNWKIASTNVDGGGTVNSFTWGDSSYHPIVGDWNGDGIDTVGLYHVPTGSWYLGTVNAAGGGNPTPFVFGSLPNDIPVVGDWNGDGIDTVGIFRDTDDYSFILWYLGSANTDGGGALSYVAFGVQGDIPLVGSWNGDSYDTVGVKRGRVYFLADSIDSESIRQQYFQLGNDEDFALVGDVIGTGIDKIGYYDTSTNTWNMPTGYYHYIISSSGRQSMTGTIQVFDGSTIPVNIIMPKMSTIPSTPFTERPEGEGVGFLQVLGYLMYEEGITEEDDQNAVLGMLIIVFCAVMVGGLVAGGYGVLVGAIFGFILSVIVGFIPIWIPITLIAIAGAYIVLGKTLGGD